MGVLEAGGEFRHVLGFCLETEIHSEQPARGSSQTVLPAQSQDARPEQSSKGVHSRTSGIWGLMRPFS